MSKVILVTGASRGKFVQSFPSHYTFDFLFGDGAFLSVVCPFFFDFVWERNYVVIL